MLKYVCQPLTPLFVIKHVVQTTHTHTKDKQTFISFSMTLQSSYVIHLCINTGNRKNILKSSTSAREKRRSVALRYRRNFQYPWLHEYLDVILQPFISGSESKPVSTAMTYYRHNIPMYSCCYDRHCTAWLDHENFSMMFDLCLSMSHKRRGLRTPETTSGLVWSGRVIRSPPLECVADGLGCLITAGPSGDGLPNES